MKKIYTPAWITNNALGNNGYVLVDYIRQVDRQGLQPKNYHLCLIEKYVGKIVPFIPMDKEDMMKMARLFLKRKAQTGA